jgi:hypothetical protein
VLLKHPLPRLLVDEVQSCRELRDIALSYASASTIRTVSNCRATPADLRVPPRRWSRP